MNHLKLPVIGLLIVTAFACGDKKDAKTSHEADIGDRTMAVVHLNRAQQELAGIKIELVQSKPLHQSITVPGRIDFNQQKLVHVTSRVAGRVEQVYRFVGDEVEANELLATIYSQTFLTAQSEFIQAENRFEQTQARGDSTDLSTIRSIYRSARQKLLIMGASEKDLEEVIKTHNPRIYLEIRSPFAGSIIEEGKIPGDYVDVGTPLFHVANLANLWVMADVNEKDLPKIRTGLDATVQVAAYPAEEFAGRITRVLDVLDEKTRTVKARVEVLNPLGKLKPQMFAVVVLQTGDLKETTVIPSTTLQLEGEDQVVYISLNDTTFSKRIVKAGRQFNGNVEIVEGVKTGERIVSAGGFTIKSEFAKASFGEE